MVEDNFNLDNLLQDIDSIIDKPSSAIKYTPHPPFKEKSPNQLLLHNPKTMFAHLPHETNRNDKNEIKMYDNLHSEPSPTSIRSDDNSLDSLLSLFHSPPKPYTTSTIYKPAAFENVKFSPESYKDNQKLFDKFGLATSLSFDQKTSTSTSHFNSNPLPFKNLEATTEIARSSTQNENSQEFQKTSFIKKQDSLELSDDDIIPSNPLTSSNKVQNRCFENVALPPNASTSASKLRCLKVVIGGTSYAKGHKASNFSNVACNNLRCTQCNFSVHIYNNCQWDATIDYLFVRTNMPNDKILSTKLKSVEDGSVAYCCQCNWIHLKEERILLQSNVNDPQWVCAGHV